MMNFIMKMMNIINPGKQVQSKEETGLNWTTKLEGLSSETKWNKEK